MLDRKFILENVDAVKLNCRNRNVVADVDRFVELELLRREKQREVEACNQEANAVSKSIGKCATPEEREAKKEEGRLVREKLAALQQVVRETEAELDRIQRSIPNMAHPDCPIGKDDGSNTVVCYGKTPKPQWSEGFKPLAEAYGIPKDNPDRAEILEAAVKNACVAPMEMVRACGLGNKVRGIIAGGSERCFSVHIALQAVDWPCDYAFIHDAARPFIDEAIIRRLYEEVRAHNACVAGVPSKDTVKIADSEGFVKNTPNRKDVWIVQTPQVFEFTLIRDAYEKMAASYDDLCAKGVIITDDAMVVEFLTGTRVKLVEASYSNIKVTTPEDMVTVLSYLKGKQ